MFPSNMQVLGRERDRERLAEAEHIRLVKVAKGQQPDYLSLFITWLGQRMVVWGEKLQARATPSSPEINATITETGFSPS